MIDRLFAIAFFIVGCPLGMGVGALVSLFVSGWIKIGIYAAFVALIWLGLWIDTSLTQLLSGFLGRIFGMEPSFREGLSQEAKRAHISTRNSLLTGVCAGLVATAILPLSDILRLLKTMRW